MTLGISIIERKAEMYEMIIALENDFIEMFLEKLTIDQIPNSLIVRSKKINDMNEFKSILHGLDFQAYIEICNANIRELGITNSQRRYINQVFSELIPIRNNVMHPRPLDVFDYPKLKGVFCSIENELEQFNWRNVLKVREIIEKNPEELKLPPNLKKSENIIENLPTVIDFEETSFIGRRKEVGEIKAKLHKKNVHILSIIGDGGIGKTALTVKLLYDILDDQSFDYELILWVSLKTNSLNKYEFSEIKDSIDSTAKMYEKLNDFIGNENVDDIPSYLINLAKEFNTLLVLDNLETINTVEIKAFLEDFTEYGQVLITSRIGLGEMEHRYKLEGLENHDLMEYINALLELYGLQGYLSDVEKKRIAINELHSNPLAIKWFVRCLYNKQPIDTILNNKTELARFCMSNVYDKLSELAHTVLDILIAASRDVTFAELMYYLDSSQYTDVSYAVNDLIKSNFIDDKRFKESKALAITEFAKEFLTTLPGDKKSIVSAFKKKDSILQSFGQTLIQRMQESPYTLKSLYIKNNNPSQIVAAYYLSKAIECSESDMEKAHEMVEYAKKLSPNYFECNKVNAYLYGTTSPSKAVQEYEIALVNCESKDEKERMHIVYAGFLLRCNDYLTSLDEIDKALLINQNNEYALFEKIKILSCINRFDEAEYILDKISYNKLSQKNKNILLTRRADLLRRKSERFDQRNTNDKFTLIKEAFSWLEKSELPDRGIYEYMGVLLKSLAYIYFDDNILYYILGKLKTYYPSLRRHNEFKKFQIRMRNVLERIENKYIRERISKYVLDINEIIPTLDKNQGVVYNIEKDKNYGFFKNEKYEQGVYFRITDRIRMIDVGDIIEYYEVIETSRGAMVRYLNILR